MRVDEGIAHLVGELSNVFFTTQTIDSHPTLPPHTCYRHTRTSFLALPTMLTARRGLFCRPSCPSRHVSTSTSPPVPQSSYSCSYTHAFISNTSTSTSRRRSSPCSSAASRSYPCSSYFYPRTHSFPSTSTSTCIDKQQGSSKAHFHSPLPLGAARREKRALIQGGCIAGLSSTHQQQQQGSKKAQFTTASSSPPLPLAARRKKRVLIQGGGIAGLSLAFFLERFLPETYEAVVVERRGEGDADPTAHLALGLWVNALRCLAEGGLSLPETLTQRKFHFSWMLDSGYLTTDGR